MTPLQLASLEGHVNVCLALIEQGMAAAGAADAHHRTPLHFAAEEGHAATVTLLVTHGAAVSAADCDGMTPLHLASEQGHARVAERLLQQHVESRLSGAPQRAIPVPQGGGTVGSGHWMSGGAAQGPTRGRGTGTPAPAKVADSAALTLPV